MLNRQIIDNIMESTKQYHGIKRKVEEPCFVFHYKTKETVIIESNIDTFNVFIQEGLWNNTDLIQYAFKEYGNKRIIEGKNLERILKVIYNSFPLLEEFIEYVKRNRSFFYLTKDEWYSLYYERNFVLNDQYVNEDKIISWPLLLEEFRETRRKQLDMDCDI
ncbi:hypothetical protein EDI_044190 [Entamoeba dispar SAW760]|uniref:Defective in cullin neddylation protein n=1 Tax=Entamoeba dispar (strain ATCC PRA-260 / SAW760) TaxID=370354 RepID=B0EHR9_ENTDS|nr:uncharacterized protein EDI_044190 [Entamoeba dispar SAW760]EDR25863.1 hypothetical protein EDI_044190 [Entamoeba dispar SAW760]|eukprot:EDR25863.1 hypothetical protein EDI_044190 [Entamoeba dispar SAW760]